jgi:hypothetical protein
MVKITIIYVYGVSELAFKFSHTLLHASIAAAGLAAVEVLRHHQSVVVFVGHRWNQMHLDRWKSSIDRGWRLNIVSDVKLKIGYLAKNG